MSMLRSSKFIMRTSTKITETGFSVWKAAIMGKKCWALELRNCWMFLQKKDQFESMSTKRFC